MVQTIPLDIVHTDLVGNHLFHCIALVASSGLLTELECRPQYGHGRRGIPDLEANSLFVSLFRTTTGHQSPVLSYQMPHIHCSNSAENSADMLLDDSRTRFGNILPGFPGARCFRLGIIFPNIVLSYSAHFSKAGSRDRLLNEAL